MVGGERRPIDGAATERARVMTRARTHSRHRPALRALLVVPALALMMAMAPIAAAAPASPPPSIGLTINLPGLLDLSVSSGPDATLGVRFSLPAVVLDLLKVNL